MVRATSSDSLDLYEAQCPRTSADWDRSRPFPPGVRAVIFSAPQPVAARPSKVTPMPGMGEGPCRRPGAAGRAPSVQPSRASPAAEKPAAKISERADDDIDRKARHDNAEGGTVAPRR